MTLKHRLEYAGFRAAIAAGSLLSDDAAARIGAQLGGLAYPLRIKRNVVESNLRTAFPEADDEWIADIARRSFRHIGRELMMMLRLSDIPRDELIARTHMVDHEQALRDAERGGVVFVAGHLGNWEIGAAGYAARGYRIDIIAKQASNPLFYRHIVHARARLGIKIIDFQVASRRALRALRDGRVVAFGADQHAGRAGIPVPFFGRPASTYRGPALLALRTGSPMYLTVPIRREDGDYELRAERIDTTPTGEMEADVQRITREWAGRLEAAVRRHPDQYLWQHRRWRG